VGVDGFVPDDGGFVLDADGFVLGADGSVPVTDMFIRS
jgi:hypothetical protein